MKLSRIQTCDKYDLRPGSFDIAAEIVKPKLVVEHGRALFVVDDAFDFALQCARNHVASFASDKRRLLPFHRFLCLKFLTVSDEELLSETRHRNLVMNGMTKGTLRHLKDRFLARLPARFKSLAKKQAPPPAAKKREYEILLQILGVEAPYKLPGLVDEFFRYISDTTTKIIIESTLTTHGTLEEKRAVIQELSGMEWSMTAIEVYASIFYDLGWMSKSDWEFYVAMLYPTERQRKRQAATMTPSAFNLTNSSRPLFTEGLQKLAVDLQKGFGRAVHGRSFKEMNQALVMFIKVAAEMGHAPKATEGYFQGLSVAPVKHPFRISQEDADVAVGS